LRQESKQWHGRRDHRSDNDSDREPQIVVGVALRFQQARDRFPIELQAGKRNEQRGRDQRRDILRAAIAEGMTHVGLPA